MCKSTQRLFCSVFVNSRDRELKKRQVAAASGAHLSNRCPPGEIDVKSRDMPQRRSWDVWNALFRLLVPKDCQSDQKHRDDPEDDIFSAVLLFRFGHKR